MTKRHSGVQQYLAPERNFRSERSLHKRLKWIDGRLTSCSFVAPIVFDRTNSSNRGYPFRSITPKRNCKASSGGCRWWHPPSIRPYIEMMEAFGSCSPETKSVA